MAAGNHFFLYFNALSFHSRASIRARAYPLILEMIKLLKIKRRAFFPTRQHSFFGVMHCVNSEVQIAICSK